MKDNQVKEKAVTHVKQNKKQYIDEFASLDVFKDSKSPVTVFMAGAPGVGKTELATRLASTLSSNDLVKDLFGEEMEISGIAHLDPDLIRATLPGYKGYNADIFQSAVTKAMDILFDHCHSKGISCIVDGTFSSMSVAERTVSQALGKKRKIIICYLYRDPLLTWEVVLSREVTEKRKVPIEAFVKSYFESKKVISHIKSKWGKSVEVWFIRRSVNKAGKTTYELRLDVEKIDGYIPVDYSEDELYSKLLKISL